MKTGRNIYIIKTVSLFAALLTVITGYFLKTKSQDTYYKSQTEDKYVSEITNLYSSVESLRKLFERAEELNSFKENSKIIYGQSQEIKVRLHGIAPIPVNTSGWFSSLSDYALTDMADSRKNKEYSEKLNSITALLLEECTSQKADGVLTGLEAFLEEKDQVYYRTKLNDLEEQYQILENQTLTEMQYMSEYVKSILNSPTVPKCFKGGYTYPKSIAYVSSNSYADIFPKGMFLGRMAKESGGIHTKKLPDSTEAAAFELLRIYAGYAGKCKIVYSSKRDNIVYYVFCPIINDETTNIINYNETIKMALNCTDNSMTAFDATDYLKNHTSNKQLGIALNNTAPPPVTTSMSVEEENTVLIKNTLYKEYKLKSENDNIYYFLTASPDKGVLNEESVHFRDLGII